MNHEEQTKNMDKTKEIMDVSLIILEYVYDIAEEMVDRKMSYSREIKKSKLESQRVELILDREKAISTICANVLAISEGVRI